MPHESNNSRLNNILLNYWSFLVNNRTIICLNLQDWIDLSWSSSRKMLISTSKFNHTYFSSTKRKWISVFYFIFYTRKPKFLQKWLCNTLSSKSKKHLHSRNISTKSKRLFERQGTIKFSICIIWRILPSLKWNIINRGINRQRQFLKSQCINQRFNRRSWLPWISCHIILSLDILIKIIQRP